MRAIIRMFLGVLTLSLVTSGMISPAMASAAEKEKVSQIFIQDFNISQYKKESVMEL